MCFTLCFNIIIYVSLCFSFIYMFSSSGNKFKALCFISSDLLNDPFYFLTYEREHCTLMVGYFSDGLIIIC